MLPRADLPRHRFGVAVCDAIGLVLGLLIARGVLAVALLACHAVEQGAKDFGADFAEITYCELEACGQVFLCVMQDGTENEWCWVDDSSTELKDASGAVSCAPTPRGGALGWPCLYCCGSKCGRGANAYQGAFCP